jgi:hypothetical protein
MNMSKVRLLTEAVDHPEAGLTCLWAFRGCTVGPVGRLIAGAVPSPEAISHGNDLGDGGCARTGAFGRGGTTIGGRDA